jgi:shikimate dehydrogenase
MDSQDGLASLRAIDGKTSVYGVIGYPVKHTLSPILHNAVFEHRKVNAVYLPFEVAPDNLYGAIEGFRSLGIKGLNVTIPHKEQVMHYLDTTPNLVDRAIGAVNTLVLTEGRALGFNSDGPGFLRDLKDQFAFEPEGRTALLIGAGGSARAVAFSMLEANLQKLYIFNRTPDRARGLAEYAAQYFPDRDIEAVVSIDDIPAGVDLAVNCTSCGMNEQDPFPIDPDVLTKVARVYDVIYVPEETKLLAEARRRGLPVSNGIGMLIHQACVSHRLWFPDADRLELYAVMRGAYEAWRKR